MLIDCDTCTARGAGCADCVVTVLLGAPPGCQDEGPVVVPLTARTPAAERRPRRPAVEVVLVPGPGLVVDLDDVERRAVQVLAQSGLVPPLRHRADGPEDGAEGRRTG